VCRLNFVDTIFIFTGLDCFFFSLWICRFLVLLDCCLFSRLYCTSRRKESGFQKSCLCNQWQWKTSKSTSVLSHKHDDSFSFLYQFSFLRYGLKALSFKLRENNRFSGREKKALIRILGPNRERVTEHWRNFRNKMCCNLSSLDRNIEFNTDGRMRCGWNTRQT
jgi:hypothetical protein